MAFCDELEARLKERANVQGKLVNSIVKNVANGAITELVGDQA